MKIFEPSGLVLSSRHPTSRILLI